MALIGLATTLAAIAMAFVPSSEETNPGLAALKVAGMTAVYAADRRRDLSHRADAGAARGPRECGARTSIAPFHIPASHVP